MTFDDLPALGSHFGALAIVALVEAWLVLRARSLGRAGASERYAQLQKRFSDDLRARARKGLPPDWDRYDRAAEDAALSVDDKLRNHASTALVLGVLGTLLMLAFSFLFGDVDGGLDDFGATLRGLGLSLVGSMLGVLSHLYIVLRIIDPFARRDQTERDDLLGALTADSVQAEVKSQVFAALEDELVQLQSAVRDGLLTAVRETLAELPLVVSRLGEQVETMVRRADDQAAASATLLETTEALTKNQLVLMDAIRPLASAIVDTTKQLGVIPGEIGNRVERAIRPLSEGMERSLTAFGADLGAALARQDEAATARDVQLRQTLAVVGESIGTATTAIASVPATLRSELKEAARDLSSTMGARNLELREALQKSNQELYQRLAKQHDDLKSTWVTAVGEVLARGVEVVASDVRDRAAQPLMRASAALGSSAETTQRAAEAMVSNVERIEELALRFAEIHATMTKVLEAIRATRGEIRAAVEAAHAGHLDAVAGYARRVEASSVRTQAIVDSLLEHHLELQRLLLASR